MIPGSANLFCTEAWFEQVRGNRRTLKPNRCRSDRQAVATGTAKDPPQPIGDLRHKALIVDEEIGEAVEACFAEPALTAFRFASGQILDIEAVVAAHAQAKAALAKQGSTDAYRRTTGRPAVILAIPTAK